MSVIGSLQAAPQLVWDRLVRGSQMHAGRPHQLRACRAGVLCNDGLLSQRTCHAAQLTMRVQVVQCRLQTSLQQCALHTQPTWSKLPTATNSPAGDHVTCLMPRASL
jgi:hypothetical protein